MLPPSVISKEAEESHLVVARGMLGMPVGQGLSSSPDGYGLLLLSGFLSELLLLMDGQRAG